MWDAEDLVGGYDERPSDRAQERAREVLAPFFDRRRETVFFSRQVEVMHEGEFFHWVTNRAIRDLEESGQIQSEFRELPSGGRIKLIWHRRYRYYRRAASAVVDLVARYSHSNVGGAIGLHGEAMVLEGFASQQFVMLDREARTYADAEWSETDHDLDFIFSRDGVVYGVEVKNTLGYPDYDEIKLKMRLCRKLGVRPVIVARMMPKSWINEVYRTGGFSLIMKYQLYPWSHRDLAREVGRTFEMPIDAPRRIAEGTMQRFLRWHARNV